MNSGQQIRTAVARVAQMRHSSREDPTLRASLIDVKRLQTRRFAGTYHDLLSTAPFDAPANFFLRELYSDKDYEDRDAQFARIAGAVEVFFPAQVAQTAVALARLHALTEELDFDMAKAWRAPAQAGLSPVARYVYAWRAVGRREDRRLQIAQITEIGQELARLTRARGLRLALKMMRGPASAAGMSSLQRFLEAGFDTFASLARQETSMDRFLQIIREREAAMIANLFDADVVACETELERILGQAR